MTCTLSRPRDLEGAVAAGPIDEVRHAADLGARLGSPRLRRNDAGSIIARGGSPATAPPTSPRDLVDLMVGEIATTRE